MNTQIITQDAYIETAVCELLQNFPKWASQFEHQVRIERAERIAKRGGIESLGDNRYSVPSERNNGEPYIVNRSVGSCECADYRNHLFDTSKTGWKCKHRIATYLAVRAAELEAQDHDAQELLTNNEPKPDPQPPSKPKRKLVSARTRKTKIAQTPEPVGTWDISAMGEVVHVCADGYNTAPIMGVGADLWCHRCNQQMPAVLMTRESRIAYNYVSSLAVDDQEAES